MKKIIFVLALILILPSLTITASASQEKTGPDYPDYITGGYYLVAHAMGALNGVPYTNSLEAFKQNYEAGHRVFEVDLQITSDDKLITIHDHRIGKSTTFKQENDAVPYTLMTFEELCYLMLEYPDFYVVTDSKYTDNDSNKRAFDIISKAIDAIDPKLADRFAIQVYNQSMYYFLTENYSLFPRENYMYTLYMSSDSNRQVIDFVKKENIKAVVMWDFRAKDKDFIAGLNDAGAAVYAHTVNDADEILEFFRSGVYGIYTDTVIYDVIAPLSGREVTYADISPPLPVHVSFDFDFSEDNQASAWAKPQIIKAVQSNLVPDSLRENFTRNITRAQFCALAAAFYENITGEEIKIDAGTETDTAGPYTDTGDINIIKATLIGVAEGVGGGRFDPDSGLTREQAAVMLSRLASAAGKPLREREPVFSDSGDISLWAVSSVGRVQAAQIMLGASINAFSPKNPYTIEQSIVTMLRLYNLFK